MYIGGMTALPDDMAVALEGRKVSKAHKVQQTYSGLSVNLSGKMFHDFSYNIQKSQFESENSSLQGSI